MKYSSLRQGLVGAWCPSISGPTGSTVIDLSSRRNHGSLVNMDPSTDWGANRYGWCLDFDGTNDYFSFKPIVPAFGMAFTCWFRAAVNNRVQHAIFANSTDNTPDMYLRIERVGVGPSAAMNSYDGGAAYLGVSTTFTLDTDWHHYGWVLDNAGLVRYYRDGIAIGTASGFTLRNDNASVATIGAIQSLVGSGFSAQGKLDDCRRYARTISPEEMRLLATEPGIGLKPEPTKVSFFVPPAPGGVAKPVLFYNHYTNQGFF